MAFQPRNFGIWEAGYSFEEGTNDFVITCSGGEIDARLVDAQTTKEMEQDFGPADEDI